MPLTELKIDSKNPKNLQEEQEDFEIEFATESSDPSDDDEAFGVFNEDADEDDDIVVAENDDDDEFFDDEDDEGDEEEEQDSSSDDEEDEESFDDDEDEDEEPLAKARGQRENDRIRTLIEERNAERKARHAAEKRTIELQKKTVETSKSLLERHIQSIKSEMTNARESGDDARYVDLTEQLTKASMDLTELQNWKEPVLEDVKFEETERADAEIDADEAFKNAPVAVKKWAKKNPWFRNPTTKKDLKRQAEAIAYANILSVEGYSLETDEFFEKVDKRLKKLGLAKTNSNNVKSRQQQRKDSSNSESEGRKTPKRKKISQTVQGASRTPASKKRSQHQKRKVILTQEQQYLAELYGISPVEYSKELLKIEEAEKKGKRMTTVFD